MCDKRLDCPTRRSRLCCAGNLFQFRIYSFRRSAGVPNHAEIAHEQKMCEQKMANKEGVKTVSGSELKGNKPRPKANQEQTTIRDCKVGWMRLEKNVQERG